MPLMDLQKISELQEEYQDTFIVKTNKKSFKFETPKIEQSIAMF